MRWIARMVGIVSLWVAATGIVSATHRCADELGCGSPLFFNTGVNSTVPQIINGVINTFLSWSTLVATALFLVGAFTMVASGGEENILAKGKTIAKAALIGLAVIVGSWMMLSTLVSFLA